ncbi:MAG: hypothetical protein HN527_02795, partial [Rhodospirillaceae bacterium]|nr:hypothetical protein [Rhodospirillaceae bacterium]
DSNARWRGVTWAAVSRPGIARLAEKRDAQARIGILLHQALETQRRFAEMAKAV